MKRFLALVLGACAVIQLRAAVEYNIPSARLPAAGTWPAAGVPNGIPTRTTIYTTINSTGDLTNRSSDINTALTLCPAEQVVVLGPGVFRCNTTIFLSGSKPNRTLRGSVDANGNPTTIIDSLASVAVQVGTTIDFNQPTNGTAVTVSSLTSGATTLTVASSSGFANTQRVLLLIANDPALGPMSTVNSANMRGQIMRIKSSGGVPDSTHVVVDAPGVFADYTGAVSARLFYDQLPSFNVGIGLENIYVTGENGVGSNPIFGISMLNLYGSYVLNCRAEEVSSAPFYIDRCFRSELRDSRAGPTDGSTSAYGILITTSSNFLIVHSIMDNSIFPLFQQGKSSGNVLAYNVAVDSNSNAIFNVNHAPYPTYTLQEGNVAGSYKNDGYHGGSSWNTAFRNWYIGGYFGGPLSNAMAIGRMSRYENIVGNQMGRTSVGTTYAFGNPNISNGSSTGTSSLTSTLSSLTTRTSATEGTITAPSGHGVTTGATIDLAWAVTVSGDIQAAKVRRNVTVGTVSGTSIPFSGGLGDDLPAQDAPIYVPTTNASLFDPDLDWDVATGNGRTWTGVLTTRSTSTTGVITLGAGQGASLEVSLAASATSGYNNIRALFGVPQFTTIECTSVVGDVVTFQNASASMPAQGSAVTLVPAYAGFQELDMDVIFTTLLKANYFATPSGGSIPAVESIGTDTLPNSLFLSSAPARFTDGGLAWPPFSGLSPNEDIEAIPAGYRYIHNAWPGGAPISGGNATVIGTTTVTGTLTLP